MNRRAADESERKGGVSRHGFLVAAVDLVDLVLHHKHSSQQPAIPIKSNTQVLTLLLRTTSSHVFGKAWVAWVPCARLQGTSSLSGEAMRRSL